MSQAELLDQFIAEARDCLEQVGQRLLDIEREPGNAELLNDLFRQVHTLKGNCGLFDFKPLERIVHAGEDLLDRVRDGRLHYSDAIADALLEAMDYCADLVDTIERDGALPEGCTARANALGEALRAHLPAGPVVAVAPAQAADAQAAPPWVTRAASFVAEGRTLLRYRPEPDCFFKGEDPWRLACTLPGLVDVDVREEAPWPSPEVFDCYQCNLVIVAASVASPDELAAHFRYVPEQVEFWPAAPGVAGSPGVARDVAPAVSVAVVAQASRESDRESDDAPEVPATATLPAGVLESRVAQLWAEQVALLERRDAAQTTRQAAARVLGALLTCLGGMPGATGALGAMPGADAPAGALLEWARGWKIEAGAVVRAQGSGVAAARAEAPAPVRRAEPAGAVPESGAGERVSRVVKVGQEKIDHLMDLIGEMVVAKNALPYLAARAEGVFQQRELSREIKAQYAVINRIAEDMQHAIMQVRMLPVGTVFQRFPRLVRDISKRLGKEVELVITGEDTEADKTMIEALADPLIHILRNSLDHGIELPDARLAAGKPARGVLRVEARQEGDRVLLEISDDGAGIDATRVRAKAVERGLIAEERARSLSDHEAVQLVFLPGFSTAETISDLSGRGVGMDVVRSAIDRVNGAIELTSRRGQGTTIRLSLPLSMAVTNVMMIEAGGRRFGVPMDLIVETVRVAAGEIHRIKQVRAAILRGRIVPIQALSDLLALDGAPRVNEEGEHALLLVRIGGETVGLLVDDFHGTSDIILKPLEGVLAGLTGFAGTALMGDGSVLMILNPKELL